MPHPLHVPGICRRTTTRAAAVFASLLLVSPIAIADWLVIDSSTARFPRYLMLDANAHIRLATGERLQLLDDGGATRELRGPAEIRLGELAAGASASGAAQDGLVGRLATLLSDPGKAETPGASRSAGAGRSATPAPLVRPGGWLKPAATGASDMLHVVTGGTRCVATLDGLVLERDPAEANSSARVEVTLPENAKPQKMTWHAGFTTLDLGGGYGPVATGGTAEIRVTPSTGTARQLRVTLVPEGGAVDARLRLMAAAGCRDDIARLLEGLAVR